MVAALARFVGNKFFKIIFKVYYLSGRLDKLNHNLYNKNSLSRYSTMAMSKYTGWQEKMGELRELFAQRNMDTAALRELAAKLTGHSGPDDVGNAARKLLETNVRLLLASIGQDAAPFETLSNMIERVAAYNAPAPMAARWAAFVHYARFLRYFGNNAVHNNNTVLDGFDLEAMVPAACKLSHLLLSLLAPPAPQPHPTMPKPLSPPAMPQPLPPPAMPQPVRQARLPSPEKPAGVPTRTLWVGNVPITMTGPELRELAGGACTACYIKVGKWNGPGTATQYNYAFLEFPTPADATAAKDHLLSLGHGFEVRFRSK